MPALPIQEPSTAQPWDTERMAVLRNALLTDGRVADVGLDGDHISWVGEGEAVGDETDLSGMLLLPAPAEPHAHLDKALTADLVANPKGDLMGAIKAWQGAYPDRTKEEIHGRAKRAAEIAVRQGITALRTHVDVGEVLGTKGIEALIAIRGEMAHLIDIQLVALIARPFSATLALAIGPHSPRQSSSESIWSVERHISMRTRRDSSRTYSTWPKRHSYLLISTSTKRSTSTCCRCSSWPSRFAIEAFPIR